MSDEKEIWKDIDGYDGIYQISTFGRVKSFQQDKVNGKIKELCVNYKGYLYVGLSKKKNYKCFLISRLVALAFIPNPSNKPIVDHIDKNKLNNHVSNLRWVTISENNRNRYSKGNIDVLGLHYVEHRNFSPYIRSQYWKEGKIISKIFTINQNPRFKNAKEGERGYCYQTKEAAIEAAKKWLKETRNQEFPGIYSSE